jgi:hypothetical protein
VAKPTKEIATQLSDGLVHLLLTELIPEFRKNLKHLISDAADFDGWEPFDATDGPTDGQYCGGDIDCVTAFHIADNNGWAFVKLQKLSTKHWRGRLSSFPPQSFDLMYRCTYNDGTAGSCRLPVVRTANYVRLHPELRGRARGDISERIEQMAEGLLDPSVPLDQTFAALSTHRKLAYWNVRLGYPGMPRSRLATDQRGVRAFFSDREVGESNRRAALLHWVTGHWRRRRPPNDEDESWVREHMRGRREFLWNGMQGEVVPPFVAQSTRDRAHAV